MTSYRPTGQDAGEFSDPKGRFRRLVGLLAVLTVVLLGCSQAVSTDTPSVLEESKRRYEALRKTVEETLNAEEGDRRIALVRDLSVTELAEMKGFISADCPVKVEQLVAVDVRFRLLDGVDGFGRLIVSQYFSQKAVKELGGIREGYVKRLQADSKKRKIAVEIAEFFIYNYRSSEPYPLEHVIPLHYFADLAREQGVPIDEVSMEFNNSYAFGPRQVRDTGKWSRHTSGAFDLNPAYNPIILRTEVEGAARVDLEHVDRVQLEAGLIEMQPTVAQPFAFERLEIDNPYVIRQDATIVAYFMERGWSWGGTWRSLKDYHHFSPGIE